LIVVSASPRITKRLWSWRFQVTWTI